MSEAAATSAVPEHAPRRGWFRLARALSVVLMLAVVIMMPMAIRSVQDVLGRTSAPFYDMVSGEPMTRSAAQTAQENAFYTNIGIVALDEVAGEVTLYLRILAVIIILLIGVSAGMPLFTRGIDDLTLGLGGLILGVWGVRSVLMPQSMGTVTTWLFAGSSCSCYWG